jgi:cobalt-precorrin 5A hydrolase
LAAYEDKPAGLIAREFQRGNPLVLVMAVGAAVRLIAPLLKNKLSDPPVVVVDDFGRYAISLVSGHAGGANDLARRVAQVINAEAIVTTASESSGIPAMEQIVRDQGWWVETGSRLTRLTAALINHETVGVFQDAGEEDWLDDFPAGSIDQYSSIEELREATPYAALVITDRLITLPASLDERYVICRPPVLVLGVGCSSHAVAEEINELANATLGLAGLSPLSVYAVATIDRRRNDPALVAFAHEHRLQLVAYSAETLDSTAGEWKESDIVRRAVGTGGVAEPAALRCAGVTALVVAKTAAAHVTVAVARVAKPKSAMQETVQKRTLHG